MDDPARPAVLKTPESVAAIGVAMAEGRPVRPVNPTARDRVQDGGQAINAEFTSARLALAQMAGTSAKQTHLALATYPAAGMVLTLAVFNVAGWGVRWQDSLPIALLFCGVAFFCEFLGFCLAIAAEQQWIKGRKDRFAVCAYSLAVCAFVNVVSGDNAWTTFEAMMVAPAIQSEQRVIDRERGGYLEQIAEIDRQLDAARPAPQAALGPQSRGEARAVYGMEISRLQPIRERLQARLDQMPLVAPSRHIIEPWMVWIGFVAIEAMKALVLWGIGMGDIGARVRSALAGPILRAQDLGQTAPLEERPQVIDLEPTPDLALEGGRALLDKLVASNVVSMRDVASKHAARPRPGRRKAA